MNTSIDNASTKAAALVGAYTNSSILRIYQGTIPTTPETAIGAQVLLATVTLPSTAFTRTNATLTANAITTVTIGTSGTAQFFRWLKSDGTTVIADGTIATSAADLNISTVSLVSGTSLAVSSFVYTVPSV